MSSGRGEDELQDQIFWSSVPSLSRKMMKAMSLVNASLKFTGECLAQVWAPFKSGDQLVLSTHDQPSLVSTHFHGYRHLSRKFTFSTDIRDISGLGPPGRVFTSGLPEWISDIIFYTKEEYLRADLALDHQVRGSIVIPIFEGSDMSCRAVLEIVTQAPKQNFDTEMETVCLALKAVNLRTNIPAPHIPPLPHLCLVQHIVLAEITNVLRGACCKHNLPLALAWIPSRSSINATRKDILCLATTACYVNDEKLHGFVEACSQYYLREGQGAAGTTFKTNHPLLCEDVKRLNICCYPFVHHARKFGLSAAIAISGSCYTGNKHYIAEFFLPAHVKEHSEQIILKRALSDHHNSLEKFTKASS